MGRKFIRFPCNDMYMQLKYHETGKEKDCLPQVGQWNMMNKVSQHPYSIRFYLLWIEYSRDSCVIVYNYNHKNVMTCVYCHENIESFSCQSVKVCSGEIRSLHYRFISTRMVLFSSRFIRLEVVLCTFDACTASPWCCSVHNLQKMINGMTVNRWSCINFSRSVQESVAKGFCSELAQMCQVSGMVVLFSL